MPDQRTEKPIAEEAPSSSAEDQEIDQYPQLSKVRDIAFIALICTAQALALAGLAQTIAPLQIIGRSLGTIDSPGQLSWYTAAFSLTVGTFILPAGRAGDILGHRNLFVFGFCWYALWSLIAGFSVYSGSIMLSVCRGFQGIGPAIIVPNALALVGRQYPMGDKKNMVFALFGAAAPTGWTLGTTFSAIFAQLTWWPWAFWTMAIVCLAWAALAYIIIPSDQLEHRRQGDGKDVPQLTFDWLGGALGVSGLILSNFGWNQGANVGWPTSYVYALFIVGCALLAAFVVVEVRYARDPLIPIKSLRREAWLALGVVGCGWASFGIWVYYQWRLLEQLRHHTALSAVAQNSPVAITGLLAAVTTGILLSKTRVAYILFASLLFFLTGMILIATVPVHQIYWGQTFVSILIMPWGMDMSFPSGTIILSNGLPKEHQGMAASLINTVVNYSISLGLGIAGTIEQQVNDGGQDVLQGYRGAWYFGISLDALGLVIAAYFIFRTQI